MQDLITCASPACWAIATPCIPRHASCRDTPGDCSAAGERPARALARRARAVACALPDGGHSAAGSRYVRSQHSTKSHQAVGGSAAFSGPFSLLTTALSPCCCAGTITPAVQARWSHCSCSGDLSLPPPQKVGQAERQRNSSSPPAPSCWTPIAGVPPQPTGVLYMPPSLRQSNVSSLSTALPRPTPHPGR